MSGWEYLPSVIKASSGGWQFNFSAQQSWVKSSTLLEVKLQIRPGEVRWNIYFVLKRNKMEEETKRKPTSRFTPIYESAAWLSTSSETKGLFNLGQTAVESANTTNI